MNTPLPLCVNCTHYRAEGREMRCYSPHNRSLVDGATPRYTPWVLRDGAPLPNPSCGRAGCWFEPRLENGDRG